MDKRNFWIGAPVLVLSLMGESALASNDPVVRAILEDSQGGKTTQALSCALLEKVSQKGKASEKKVLRDRIAALMREGDAEMYRARGDASRLGLYGFKKNEAQALQMYVKAATLEKPSSEAGYNAALMMFRAARERPDQGTARRILDILQKSGATSYNVKNKGIVQAHYIAARIQEQGFAGTKDMTGAYRHYRAAARGQHVESVYHYMRMLASSLGQISEAERAPLVTEMRMMSNQWKWSSVDVMRLTGDLHAGGWFPDEDGFQAQYHWRIAARMEGASARPDHVAALQTRVRPLSSPAAEKRLEQAVAAAMKSNMFRPGKKTLEFSDLCS